MPAKVATKKGRQRTVTLRDIMEEYRLNNGLGIIDFRPPRAGEMALYRGTDTLRMETANRNFDRPRLIIGRLPDGVS